MYRRTSIDYAFLFVAASLKSSKHLNMDSDFFKQGVRGVQAQDVGVVQVGLQCRPDAY